jgi:hypothetical protein
MGHHSSVTTANIRSGNGWLGWHQNSIQHAAIGKQLCIAT